MQFIRQNLFLIIVVAVVLVVGGAMLAMNFRTGEQVDQEVAARVKLSGHLRRLHSAGISSEMVEAEDARVTTIKKAARGVTETCIEWNRKNYKVLSVTVDDGTGRQEIRAFPVDRELYETKGLKFKVTEKYLKTLRGLLAPLNAARIPTPKEIEDEKRVQKEAIQARLDREERLKAAGREPAADAVREDVEREAKREATNIMRIRKARGGLIYADWESLDPLFRGANSLVPYEDIWKAQLNLWVTEDILAAIAQTNAQSLAGVDEKDRNVLTAGIKHLVKIDITESYVTEKTTARRSTGITAPTAGGRESTARKARIDNLTRRLCTRQYDVIHYTVTLIMSTPHVLSFQRNLMARNFHTVLSIELADLAGLASKPDPLYYYGTEPVMQVTLRGELLLLTAWERGTWEKEKSRWSKKFPPLIPKEALRTIGSSALRPEDDRRLKK